MATTDYIAAIEISSSHISGIAGKRDPLNGDLIVMALARTPEHDTTDYIRRGLIFNIDKAANAINNIILTLEGQLKSGIGKVYVSTGGQSLRTVANEIGRTLDEDVDKITEEIVNGICDENRTYPIEEMDILDVEPQEYLIDGTTLVSDPVGVAGRSISGRFQNIVARQALRKNLEACLEQSHVEMTDLILTPRSVAATVLSEADRRSGCALIDMGDATTTISVYKNNILRYLSVLPLGSAQITRDLAQTLEIEEDEAEELKHTYGCAEPMIEGSEADSQDEVTTRGGQSVKRSAIADITSARAEEILENVWNQVQQSGYDNKLFTGLILCGGGANLSGIEEVLRRISGIDKVKVVRDATTANVRGSIATLPHDGSQLALLGLLALGRENCANEPIPAEEPKVPETAATPVNESPDMFADDEDLKKLEAERLEQKIREEKEAAEAAKARAKADAERKAAEIKNQREKEKRGNFFKKFGKQLDKITNDLFGEDSDNLND